jgi:RHS repeat-associated protein
VESNLNSFAFAPNLYDAYFYHSDHLGSSNYISNNTGIVSQHTEYLPFGETFVDEHLNSHNTPFKFNAKEFDDETGNYYYGARYYNPKWNVWLSVDPLVEKTMDAYGYCYQNPLRFTDPDGRIPIIPWLIKAGAGAAADMLAQAGMDYLFNSNTTNWSQAFDNVNWWQVGRSGAEALIPFRTTGGRIGKAAGTATGDVLVNAMNNPSGYTAEQAGMDFLTGFIGDLAGGGMADLISKYGYKSIANGLMNKLGMDYGSVMKMMGGGAKSINKTINGITSTRMMQGWAKGKIAVIGRGMDNRVIPFAEGLGAEYWKGWDGNLSEAQNLLNNQNWVQGLKDQGYTIYDIGTGPISNEKGAFYGMETKEIFGDD